MLLRLLIGIIKGLFVGVAVGAGLHYGLGVSVIASVWLAGLLYAAVGGLAGFIAGKPFWRNGAGIEAILRAVFGLIVGVGLYALANKFLPTLSKLPFPIPVEPPLPATTKLADIPLLFAPALAVVYSALVELDNDGKAEETAPSRVRVVDVDDIKVDEEEPVAKSAKPAKKQR